MTNNNIKEYELIHDSIVVSYMVDFKKEILQLNTNYHGKEATIKFQGLLAHDFENVIRNNIIFSISQVTIECFILEKSNILVEALKYGFPTIEVCSIKELEDFLKVNKYKIFYIESSMGMVGYVIAKEINIF